MKKISITFVVLFVTSFLFAQTEPVSAVGIKFETGTWAEILAKAKKEKKYVFLDAYTTWCGPCKWMDKNVFPTAEAGEFFNKNFVNAKMDMEKGEGLEIAKTYLIRAYPTYVYVDGDGKLVHRVVGSMPTDRFIAASAEALNPETQYGTLISKFEAGERSPDFLYNAAKAAQKAYDEKNVKEIAAAYLKTQSNLLDEKNVKFIIDFTPLASDPNFEFMRKNAPAFEAALGGKDKYDARLYRTALQSSYVELGVKGDLTKEQVPEYIAKAKEYFHKVLPEQETKLLAIFSIDLYRITKDWENYAKHAIAYYDKNTTASSGELNSVAWTFFEHIDNKDYLNKALAYSLQSVKLQENAMNLDTVANLYNKLGDKNNAKLYIEKAIVLAKANGEDTSSAEKLLKEVSQ